VKRRRAAPGPVDTEISMSGIARLIRTPLVLVAALCVPVWALAQMTTVPAVGQSKKVDEIKKRGSLRVAVIGEFPWLPENTSGSGPKFSGPAWILAEEYAKRLGVKLETIPVSHETKVPILASGQADLSIAPLSVTETRLKVVDFVVYSKSSICYVGLASNAKLASVTSMDDLNRDDLTIAYFTGSAPEPFLPKRFPKAKLRAVQGSGANVPLEEIMSKRADVAPLDYIVYPKLNKEVPGLRFVPEGDNCLRSTEMATPVGLALAKGDSAFHNWLMAVEKEIHQRLEDEELRIVKEGEK
jgi:polar amino acid transport system substrate-binding protein